MNGHFVDEGFGFDCLACYGIAWLECVRCRRWYPCTLCGGRVERGLDACTECAVDRPHAAEAAVA